MSRQVGILVTSQQLLVTCFFLFLWLLRCFTSPGRLRSPMNSDSDVPIFHQDGFPHSDIPGSKVACHLTEAFRRLLRPSSSFDVEASTICSYFPLNHKNQNTCGCEIEFVLDLSIVKLPSDTNLRIDTNDTNMIRSHS